MKTYQSKLFFVLTVIIVFMVVNLAADSKDKFKVLTETVKKMTTVEDQEHPLLEEKYTLLDETGRYVYKVDKSFGVKQYLKYKADEESGHLVILEGLKRGDEIITFVLVEVAGDMIKGKFISKADRVAISVMKPGRYEGKYIMKKEQKKKKPAAMAPKPVKYEFEASFGTASNDFEEFYLKDQSSGKLISQYASLSGGSFSESGSLADLGSFMPISLGANYMVAKDLYVKGGVEFASVSGDGSKDYSIQWGGLSETYAYQFSHKFSYVLPYVGIEKRFNNFGIYLNLGMNSIKYDYQLSKAYTEQAYTENTNETIKASGSAFSLMIGAKYRVRIVNRLHAFVKVEYLMSSLSSISADSTMTGSNSDGGSVSDSVSGTIYTFNTDPYSNGKIQEWGVFQTLPTESWLDGFTEMSLKLSTIRISLGLSF